MIARTQEGESSAVNPTGWLESQAVQTDLFDKQTSENNREETKVDHHDS